MVVSTVNFHRISYRIFYVIIKWLILLRLTLKETATFHEPTGCVNIKCQRCTAKFDL